MLFRKEIIMKFENIIFDVDGTLWDTTKTVADSWNYAVETLGYPSAGITGEQLKNEFGKTMDVIAEDLFPHLPVSERDVLMEACCRWEDEFLERLDIPPLYPDIRETVAALAGTHRLFIVSNCQSGYIELFLRKTGLGKYVTDIECFGNTKKTKGENIRLVMDRNIPGSTCYVGDTAGDQKAAKWAGIPFIYASYGFGQVDERDCFASISSIRELTKVTG